MLSHRRPWRSAWVESAYGGPGVSAPGYWRTESPADHFRTAATSTTVLSRLVLRVLAERPWIRAVVDLGAGTGALANAVVHARRDLDVYAVDVRERPLALDDDVAWCHDLWDVDADRWSSGEAEVVLATLDRPTLVLAVEWLDDLPCTIGTREPDGVLRQVEVDADGAEHAGAPLTDEDVDWVRRWWPGSRVGAGEVLGADEVLGAGQVIEVGLTRDRAWADAIGRLRSCGGAGLVVDYGHLRGDRPKDGSLAAYARGERRAVVPSPEVNLTAHVAVDSVRRAGEDVGAATVEVRALAAVVADHPDEAVSDPLAVLVHRSERGALTAGGIWGAQHWLLQEVGAPRRRTATPAVVD